MSERPAGHQVPTGSEGAASGAPAVPPREPSHAERCRTLVASARRGALSTVAIEPPGYPYGSVDAAAVRAVEDAGYSWACAVTRVPGLTEGFALPRIGVAERDDGARFAARLLLRGR